MTLLKPPSSFPVLAGKPPAGYGVVDMTTMDAGYKIPTVPDSGYDFGDITPGKKPGSRVPMVAIPHVSGGYAGGSRTPVMNLIPGPGLMRGGKPSAGYPGIVTTPGRGGYPAGKPPVDYSTLEIGVPGRYPPTTLTPGRAKYPPGTVPMRGKYPPSIPTKGRYPPGIPTTHKYPPGVPTTTKYPPGVPTTTRYPPGVPKTPKYPPGLTPPPERYPPGKTPPTERYPPGTPPETPKYPPGELVPPELTPPPSLYPPGRRTPRGHKYPPGTVPTRGKYPPGRTPSPRRYPPGEVPPGHKYPPGTPKKTRYPPGVPTTTKYPPGVPETPPEYPPDTPPPPPRYPPPKVPPKTPPPPRYPPPRIPPTESELPPPFVHRQTFVRGETEKLQPPKLRLHFDVMGSKWNIRNPIPRMSEGAYPLVELKVHNVQYSRDPMRYVEHRPYDKFVSWRTGAAWNISNPVPRPTPGKYPKQELKVTNVRKGKFRLV